MRKLIDIKKSNNIKEKNKNKNDIDDNEEFNDLWIILNIPIIKKTKIIVKDSKYYYKKYKIFLKNIIICTTYIDWIFLKVKEEVISNIIMNIMIQLMIFKKMSKIHLIHFIIIFIIFFKYSNGKQFDDHGYFNFFFYFIILGIITFILFPFDLIIYFSKGKKRISILLIYLSFFFISIYIFIFHLSKCSGWSRGLNDTYIDNDNTKYGCQIQIPRKCVYKILGSIQDYTKLGGKNCTKSNNKEMKDIIFKFSKSSYINNTANRVGFPLTILIIYIIMFLQIWLIWIIKKY